MKAKWKTYPSMSEVKKVVWNSKAGSVTCWGSLLSNGIKLGWRALAMPLPPSFKRDQSFGRKPFFGFTWVQQSCKSKDVQVVSALDTQEGPRKIKWSRHYIKSGHWDRQCKRSFQEQNILEKEVLTDREDATWRTDSHTAGSTSGSVSSMLRRTAGQRRGASLCARLGVNSHTAQSISKKAPLTCEVLILLTTHSGYILI